MSRSRRTLEQHFDPATARILDALVEGLSIHRADDQEARTVPDGPHTTTGSYRLVMVRLPAR